MTETANLGLPFIDGSQAQKHVTHNEALRILDDAIQIAVLDTTLTAPPSSPADGERHIVASGAAGAWAGQGNAVATWETNAWRFLVPKAGWCVWSIDDDALLVFDGSAWTPVTMASATLDNAPHVAINTTVAGSNLLTVRSNDALLNAIETADGGTGDVRLQLSKSAAGNTASVVFSDAFSGRAEFGLTGDDDFHLKVSADGTTWRDALRFDRATGRASFPSGGAREILAADRTYYVRADGNDSNDGLSNTSGGAFLTIAKVLAVVTALDLGGFTATIQVGAGTWTGPINLPKILGGSAILLGDETTPSNVVISSSSSWCVSAYNIDCTWSVRGFTLTSSGSSVHGFLGLKGNINYQNIEFGSCSGAQIWAGPNACMSASAGTSISGGAPYHWYAEGGGTVLDRGVTITITGTPAFSTAFAHARTGGIVSVGANTFSGSATGKRYSAQSCGVIEVYGASTTYLPGDTAGTGTNPGVSPYGMYG